MFKINFYMNCFFLLFIIPALGVNAYEVVYTLEAYLNSIETVRKEKNLSPAEMLICLDLDKVSVKDGTSKPLEGETTTFVYRELIKKGYPVLMLTARNNGLKADEESWNDLYDMTVKLHRNLRDNSYCFKNVHNFKKIIRYNRNYIQYGYFINGVFYAGQEKGDMLAAIIPTLEKAMKKPFKVLFMVDDKKSYLQTFKDCQSLVDHFERENMHLIHFAEVRRVNEEGYYPSLKRITNSRKRKFNEYLRDSNG